MVDFVGRRKELDRITGVLDAAEARTPIVLLLEGTTGIGKTTLLNAAAELARERGFQVGLANASRMEKELPFGVTRQMFEDVLSDLPGDEAESAFRVAGSRGSGVINATPADPLEAFEEVDVHQALRGLYRLTTTLTPPKPLCFIVDDLQWTDVPSLRWLNYLVCRVTRMPLAVLLSQTTGIYPESPLLIAELDFYAERVKIGGFADGEIAEMTEKLLGVRPAPEFISACAETTGRNPFILSQLLATMRDGATPPDEAAARDLARQSPDDLGGSVLARLNRQSPHLVRIARIIAVLEPPGVELTAAVAGTGAPEVADAVRQLVGMGLLANNGKLAFTHSMIQNAIANAVTHTERDEMHASAARYLHEVQAPDLLVAKHIRRTTAKLGTWAAANLSRAAKLAVVDGDPVTGADLLSRALKEDMAPNLRRDLLIRLGRAETYFDPHQAAVHLTAAMEYLVEPQAILGVACRLSQVLYLDARYDEAREVLTTSIDKVEPVDPVVGGLLRLALRVTVPTPHREPVHTHPAEIDPTWREGGVRGRLAGALIADYTGNAGEEFDLCRESALVALSGGVVAIMNDPQRLLAAVNGLIRTDEFDLALRHSDEIVLEARQHGLEMLSVLGYTLRSRVHLSMGALAAAAEDARLAVAPDQQSCVHSGHLSHVQTVEALVHSLLLLGDVEGAQAAIEPVGLRGTLPRSWQHTALLHVRGLLRFELGDVEGALADQLECGERLLAWGAPNPAHRPWRSHAALAQLRLGRRQEALQLALEELELARRWGAPSSTARALLAVAATTRDAAALPWLNEAASVLTGSSARLLRARVLSELGTVKWRIGQREAARENLAQAKVFAEACGSVPLLSALAELPAEAVCRSKALPAAPLPVGTGLTPHEFRVASMVVEGHSNVEIAEKLYVTRRAVEFHLTNIYRKLGVRRRTQLPSALKVRPGVG
ncbi:LuxR family transcriptional regulator [Lentzea roselyniae]|uniref:LuxR family transcriptional regulator n=1 Tax=Lentzea roselyniae TaxID=531940 RepID=A0ABP7C3A7_9PSEU